ncbi:MAG: hypothetical protein ABR583_05545 [Gaiellaceae bacterium]
MGRLARVEQRWRRVVVATALLLLAAACGGGHTNEVPERLVDGSRPPAAPAALARLSNPVMTRARVFDPRDQLNARRCLRSFGSFVQQAARAVERIGTEGRSLTLVAGPLLAACDAAAGAREGGARWCGGAAGKRRSGVLTDPRLDLANCVDAEGRAVGFTWIEPLEGAGWVAVERDGYFEVYPVAGGAPVRIATTDGIDAERSSLRFEVIQLAPDGRTLKREEVEAGVAG